MSNVFVKIVEDKYVELVEWMVVLLLDIVKVNFMFFIKSLFDVLFVLNVGFILECKKVLFLKGLICEKFDLDEILVVYMFYVVGIFVLIDEKYFQGNYDYFVYVIEWVEQLVLNKDFFVNEYQVYLVCYYNVDVILLMLLVFDDEIYLKLVVLVDSLVLDILIEVSNEEEMQCVIVLKVKIIGINNWDLCDLFIDLVIIEKLVFMLVVVIYEYVVISEFGIYIYQDVLCFVLLCQGFLVGSVFMVQVDFEFVVK